MKSFCPIKNSQCSHLEHVLIIFPPDGGAAQNLGAFRFLFKQHAVLFDSFSFETLERFHSKLIWLFKEKSERI